MERLWDTQEHEGVARSDIYLLHSDYEKKSHGLIPTHTSQRCSRAVKLPTTTYFPMFPSTSLAILFTGMLVGITFTGLPPASVGFLLDLFFDPKDGGDIFLRNVGLSPKYAVLHPEDRTVRNHSCDTLKSNFVTVCL
jgi:hypothetical protein